MSITEDFNHPILDEAMEALNKIHDLEYKLELAKQKMQEALNKLPEKIGQNTELQEDILGYFYWFHQTMPTTWLSNAFHIPISMIGRRTGKAEIPLMCRRCGETKKVIVTSRSRLNELEKVESIVCKECIEASRQQTEEQNKKYFQRLKERKQELQQMPYRDYLQTEEWKERRSTHLKRAKYKCQVCNAGNLQLNVHHRTYERRGDELASDLIVLCQPCHQLFHINNKLAEAD